jgi:hypothetical protein
MSRRAKRLSASQVGQYAFCARAWWLGSVERKTPVDYGALEGGVRVHERHGWQVSLAQAVRRLALWLFLGGGLLLLVWGASTLLAR